MPRTIENLIVKSRLSPCSCAAAFRKLNSMHKKRPHIFLKKSFAGLVDPLILYKSDVTLEFALYGMRHLSRKILKRANISNYIIKGDITENSIKRFRDPN